MDSEKWLAIRVRVRKRAKDKCELCGKDGQTVHHTSYENVTRELMRDLLFVCKTCHSFCHHKRIIPYSERIYDEEYGKVVRKRGTWT